MLDLIRRTEVALCEFCPGQIESRTEKPSHTKLKRVRTDSAGHEEDVRTNKTVMKVIMLPMIIIIILMSSQDSLSCCFFFSSSSVD